MSPGFLSAWSLHALFPQSFSHSVMSNSLQPCGLTAARQGPLPMEFSRQEYWSGLPFPSPEDLPDPVTEPVSPALQADSLLSEPPGKPPFPESSFSCYGKYLTEPGSLLCLQDDIPPAHPEGLSHRCCLGVRVFPSCGHRQVQPWRPTAALSLVSGFHMALFSIPFGHPPSCLGSKRVLPIFTALISSI